MARITSMDRVSMGAIALSLAFGAGNAAAQTASPAVQSAPEDSAPAADSGHLEEIIVTAQKRAEKAQSVPVAISTFSAKALTNLQITSSGDLANFVPGLNVTRANVASIPYLRGVGNFTATPGNEAAISTYVDDVYYASPAGSTFSYNNTARIEVLKGPQGTLFGRNAAGGVIAVYTKDPTAKPTLDVSAGYGNYDTVTGSLYASTGIAPNLVADLSLYGEDQGKGWGHNLANGEPTYLSNEISARSKIIWQPSTDWKVRLILDYDKTRNDSSSVLSIIPGTRSILGSTNQGGFYDTSTDFSTVGRQKQYGASLRIDHDLGWMTVASITAYRHSTGQGNQDTDVSALNYSYAAFLPKENTTTEELQLAAPTTSRIKWILGSYFFFDNAGLDPITQFGPTYAAHPGDIQYVYGNQHTTSYAFYGQATAPLFAETNLTLGVRYTDDYRTMEGNFYDRTGAEFNKTYQTANFPKPTWRASLDHKFAKDILGYISYNRGFKSGNFTVNSPAAPVVKPEVIDAYEAGVKSELFDHKLRLNLSAFYYKFNDLQVQESLSTGTVLLNAASASYKGVDFEANAVITSQLSLMASAEVLDAKYLAFPSAVYNFACVTTTTAPGCAHSVAGGGYYTAAGNAAGNQIPYAERGNATLSAIYTIPLQSGSSVMLTASGAYHSGFYFDVQNTLDQHNYTLFDSAVTWTSASKKWDVKIWGKNLGGVHYYAQQQVNATSANYSANPPRTFGFTVSRHVL